MIGAWHDDRWVAWPADVYAALGQRGVADDVPVNPWPARPRWAMIA